MAASIIATNFRRPLGTMVVYGFVGGDVAIDLAIATQIGAECVEVLPEWRVYPDPTLLRHRVADAGLRVHSAHGCWGGRSISGGRVDLAQPDENARATSLLDLQRCVDWLAEAGGSCLVVHPGGLSQPSEFATRTDRVQAGLRTLADHATGTGVVVCVENMPPGVHPGSRMADLFAIVAEIDHPCLALALDTGHAHLTSSPAEETRAAQGRLATTHVHDNDGRLDAHLPPGLGSVDWTAWVASLDAIEYRGPVMLECIRHLRQFPETMDEAFLTLLRDLCGLNQ